MLEVFDISAPTNPVSICSVASIGSAGRVAISGNYAYVTDYDNLWVSLIDISDPTNATILGSGRTAGLTTDLACSGDYAYVAEIQNFSGISVHSRSNLPPRLNLRDNLDNTLLLSWPTPTSAFAVQESPDLNPGHWLKLTNLPVVADSLNRITIPTPQQGVFYRLVSQ
jgi:hypothetical protein